MADETNETTQNQEEEDVLTFKIQGVPVKGQERFHAGHVCSEAEAAYLCRAERGIVSAALNADVKEMVEENDGVVSPEIISQVQEMVDKIWGEIKLGERRPGSGRSADPVKTRAMQILRDRVKEALAQNDYDVSEIPAKQISEMAKKVFNQKPEQYLEQARQLIEIENQKFETLQLDLD